MCGISGFYRTDSSTKTLGERHLKVMNDKIAHRGPDGEGVWLSRNDRCGLGHRRLSIVDLSAVANQPMSSCDGSVHIVFNGEIYNHKEIREELERLNGYEWKTNHSDTEVIINAYKEWGIACVDKFRGMFAICIYDEKKDELYLIRDRMGVKPLYYTINSGNIIFSSEIKAILPVLEHKPTINETSLYDYFSFLCAPSEDTMFKGIYKLRPGTMVAVKGDGSIIKSTYYDLLDNTYDRFRDASDGDIQVELMKCLRESITYRKEGDVPIGVFLSGGVDSSTNLALFSEGTSEVKSFCIGYEFDGNLCEGNENEDAKKIADKFGSSYYEKIINETEWLGALSEVIKIQDEPIADPTCVSSYYVSKLAIDNGIKVCQAGEGADELFCGYNNWFSFLKTEQMLDKMPKFGALMCHGLMNMFESDNSIRLEAARRKANGNPIFWSGAEAFYYKQKQRLISEKLKKQLKGYSSFSSIEDTYKNFKEKDWEQSNLNWMSYVDLCHRLPELLLMRTDKMGMAVSLEARVPFLDHKFVELAMSISADRKIAGGVTKRVLKDSVRGIVPDDVLDRKKKGFAGPVYQTFLSNLAHEMQFEVERFCQETELLNLEYVKNTMSDGKNLSRMWYLYNLAVWYREYVG